MDYNNFEQAYNSQKQEENSTFGKIKSYILENKIKVGLGCIIILVIIIIFVSFKDNKNSEFPMQNKFTAHTAKAMVVTCMDFRLLGDESRILREKGYEVNYDQFVLAGVSIGILQENKADWFNSLIEHINMSINLHHIKEIILMDHLDCGAYKTFIPNLMQSKEKEEHIKNLNLATLKLQQYFPDLIFRQWIVHLDGKLDIIK